MSAPGTQRKGPSPARATSPAIECRGLVKRYGALVAVAGLDLRVEAGECFGLLGPNGAGKTSTIEVLEGLQAPDAGRVRVLGLSWDRDAPALRQRLGVQLQETRLPERLTVAETIRLFRSFYTKGRAVDAMLDLVRLREKRDARVGRLSGGQRQRLGVACSLVGDPDLLFLDEPTTGLDPQSRLALWSLIEEYRALGRTVLLTTHYMEEAARLCDRVAIMDAGRILALGTPRELVASLGGEHIVEIGIGDGDRSAGTGAASPAGGAGAPGGDVARWVGTVERLPGVKSVRADGDRLRLSVTAVEQALPALVGALEARGLVLTSLSTHEATLEDVFVDLTGRGLRDE